MINFVEMNSRLPDIIYTWSRGWDGDEVAMVLADLHRDNPGMSREDEVEILAITECGWLY